MILDAIIGLFESLFSFLFEGVAAAVVPIVNLGAVAVEAVVGIFVSGFSLGRMERKKHKPKSRAEVIISIVPGLLVLGVVVWLFVAPKVMNRSISLVATDGHSLPFAALVIHTGDGDLHRRTDNAGNIEIPRFSTDAITVKDPRYIEKTWLGEDIEPQLIVERTILGSGLDSLADKLLERAKK